MPTDESTPPAPDWPAIRHAYETTTEPRDSICHRCGITSWQLSDRAKLESWPPRRPRSPPHKDTLKQRRRMVARLLATLEAKLTNLEERMAKNGSGTAVDSDRDARELSAIVRGFEKVADADDKLKRRKSRKSSAATAVTDATALREQLLQRLASLRQQRGSPPPAG